MATRAKNLLHSLCVLSCLNRAGKDSLLRQNSDSRGYVRGFSLERGQPGGSEGVATRGGRKEIGGCSGDVCRGMGFVIEY